MDGIISRSYAVHAAIGLFMLAAAGPAAAQPPGSFGHHLVDRIASPTPAAYHARTSQLIVASGGEVTTAALQNERRVEGRLIFRSPGDEVLRLRIDARRDRLWILDVGQVHVFDLAKNRLIRSVRLPRWLDGGHGANCLPDLQIDQSGAAFVSSTIQQKLWRIDGGTFAVREHRVSLDTQRDVDAGFSALAVTRDGSMYAAMAAPGSLWRIDPASFRARKVPLTAALHGACAIETLDEGGSRALTLFVLAAGPARFDLRRVDLIAGSPRAYVDHVSVAPIAARAGLLARDGALYVALHDPASAVSQRARTEGVIFSLRPVFRRYQAPLR